MTANSAKIKVWDVYLSNGEFFAKLRFSREQIQRLFEGAKIRGSKVTLMA